MAIRPMAFYGRNLPHRHLEGASLFLAWRLHGTLPRGTGTPVTATRQKGSEGTGQSACATNETPGGQFKRLDLELDRLNRGPRWLADAGVASCTERTIVDGDAILQQYRIQAYVSMPNHVHLLLQPIVEAKKITKGIKGVSARKANAQLGRAGNPFWQDESFDHWVRSEEELGRIQFYIEYNPVRAGLVTRPEDWRSSGTWLRAQSGASGLWHRHSCLWAGVTLTETHRQECLCHHTQDGDAKPPLLVKY